MLIQCDRHKPKDLKHWQAHETCDLHHAESKGFKYRLDKTLSIIKEYMASNRFYYVGVSWGKDSVVLAHMIRSLKFNPLFVYIRMLDNENPYSEAVRDIFLFEHEIKYEEFSYSYRSAPASWFKNGKPVRWYQILNELKLKYGAHVTGIRKDESAKRKMRFIGHGRETVNSFAPFEFFTVKDVFAYLAENDLPVHPNYAMLGGGRYERDRLRVASLGNKEGDGIGRAEWEKEYYPDLLRRIEANVSY